MNDRELESYAEHLPSILASASRAAAQIPDTDSSTQDELLAALGVALAAAMRLRAELRLEASGELEPYEPSVLVNGGEPKPTTDPLTQGELQAALGVARAAALRLNAERWLEAANEASPSRSPRPAIRAVAAGRANGAGDGSLRGESPPLSNGHDAASGSRQGHPDQL